MRSSASVSSLLDHRRPLLDHLSDRDRAAQTLTQAMAAGILG